MARRPDDPTATAPPPGPVADVQPTLLVPATSPSTASDRVGDGGDALPERLGSFQVLSELGRGGMGVVVEARDLEIRRNVAVKLMRAGPDVTPEQVRRFIGEARINGQLEHPGIVPVYALGAASDGRVWFAMRKVQGRTLRDVLRAARDGDPTWSRHRLLVAFVQIAKTLAYAHGRGVLHRDVKPANVLLGDYGEVFVVDWGVAEAASLDGVAPEPVAPGAVVGTPGYMSPEQLDAGHERLDERSDVWALGVMLYEILTLRSPFPGATPRERVARMMTGPPTDPRDVDPDVPEEIAAICLRALRHSRDERTPSAAVLAAEVEAFLEGSKRRSEADQLLADARARWADLVALEAEQADLAVRRGQIEARIPAWAPLHEKEELLAVRRREAELASARIDRFEDVLATCERALARDPGHAGTKRFLADVYWARFVEAEAAGDPAATARFRSRLEAYDDGRYRARLRGTGALSLRTDVPAQLWARRFDPRDLVWTLGPRRSLGAAPVEEAPLEMGSWVIEIEAEGRDRVVYPVRITRSRHWEGGLVRLPAPGEIAPGFVYVPAGPFVRGGDPEPQSSRPREEVELGAYAIAVLPVTMADYCVFLNALDPDEAWERCPRVDAGLDRSGPRIFARPGPDGYVVPAGDEHGPWSPDFPVHSVTWEDGRAYAAWKSASEGRRYALPTEDQWEKAARGVDGRIYPWGDGFDPSLCKMNASREGTPSLEPVGAFPTDVSVYGVRDMAGSMRCWCADETFDGDPVRRPVRGGSYATNARVSRCAVRYGSPFRHPIPYQGFRLVQLLDG